MEDFKKLGTDLSRSHLCSRLYTKILNGVFQNSGNDIGVGSDVRNDLLVENSEPLPERLKQEASNRLQAGDYLSHYIGHCNTTTDIKEAIFLGQSGDFIAAGSDDGNLFIWETVSGNVVRILAADQHIVNCVQCHPSDSLIATSGIGHTVKLWEPTSFTETFEYSKMEAISGINQSRMNADPIEMLFMHMGDLAHVFSARDLGLSQSFRHRDEEEDDETDEDEEVSQDRLYYLRTQRPDENGDGGGGGGVGGGTSGGDRGGNAPFSELQCWTG